MLVSPVVSHSLPSTDIDVLLLHGICVQYKLRACDCVLGKLRSWQGLTAANKISCLFLTIRILQLFYLFFQSFLLLLNYYTNYCTYIKCIQFTH